MGTELEIAQTIGCVYGRVAYTDVTFRNG
jgi:hypothetical protein